MALVQRRRGKPWRRGRPLLLLVTTAALLPVVAAFTSATVRTMGPDRAPYPVALVRERRRTA